MAKLWKQEGQNVLLTSGKMTINDIASGPLQLNVQGASYLNGLVGIQEPTPQGLLHVKGVDTGASPQNAAGNQIVIENGGASASADLQFLTSNTGFSHIFMGDEDDSNVGIIAYNHNNDSLVFDTNAATRMVLDSSGRLALGTLSPDEAFHLHNTSANSYVYMSGGGSLGETYGGFVRGYGVGGEGGHLQLGVVDAGSKRVGIEITEQGNNLIFNTANVQRIFVDASGNIAIGPTASTDRLNVQGAARIGDGTNFVGLSSSASGSVIESIGVHNLGFNTSGIRRLDINSAGTMFIGSSANQYSSTGGLNITQSVSGESTPLGLSNQSTTNGSGVVISHRGLTSTSAQNDYNYIKMLSDDTTNGSGNGSIRFWTQRAGTLAERVTITNYLGIGIDNPASGLHARGSATADSRITLEQTTAGLTSQIQQGSSGLSLNALGSQSILLNTNGVDRFKLDENGNLSLGTTSNPGAYRLNVTDDDGTGTLFDFPSTASSLVLNSPSAGVVSLTAGSGDQIVLSTGGLDRINVLSNGNTIATASAGAFTDYGILTAQDTTARGLTIGYDSTNDRSYLFSRHVGIGSKSLNISNMMTINPSAGVVVGDGAGATATARFSVTDGSTARYHIAPSSTTCFLHARNYANNGYVSAVYGATQHIFEVNGVESGRFANGNLGLGEMNPTFKLESTAAIDGEHIGLLIHNSQANTAASVNEAAYMLFGFGGDKDVARIGATKETDYTSSGNANSSLDFFTDTAGTVSKKMSLGSQGYLALASVGASAIGPKLYPLHVKSNISTNNNTSFLFEVEGTSLLAAPGMKIQHNNANHAFGSVLEVKVGNIGSSPTPDKPRIDWNFQDAAYWSWGGRANSASNNFCLFKDGGASAATEGTIVIEVDHTDNSIQFNGDIKLAGGVRPGDSARLEGFLGNSGGLTSGAWLTADLTSSFDDDPSGSMTTNSGVLTVPPGVTRVRLTAGFDVTCSSAMDIVRAFFRKNGASLNGLYDSRIHVEQPGSQWAGQMVTGVIPVVAGDQFIFEVRQDHPTSTVATLSKEFITMEIVK